MSETSIPRDVAAAAAKAMWATDKACHGLGIEIVEVGPGFATLAMVVRDDMLNGHATAHGGYIFALADSAFAYACNSDGMTTVAQHCSITFVRPGRRGDRLVATAREVSKSGRSGIYDVTVSVEGRMIAEFRGLSRATGGSFLEPSTKSE